VARYRAIFPSRQNSFNTEPQGSCVAVLGKFNCFARQCIGLTVKQTLGSDRCSVARPSGAAIGIAALSKLIGHQFVFQPVLSVWLGRPWATRPDQPVNIGIVTLALRSEAGATASVSSP